jgi:hypothetical protein
MTSTEATNEASSARPKGRRVTTSGEATAIAAPRATIVVEGESSTPADTTRRSLIALSNRELRSPQAVFPRSTGWHATVRLDPSGSIRITHPRSALTRRTADCRTICTTSSSTVAALRARATSRSICRCLTPSSPPVLSAAISSGVLASSGRTWYSVRGPSRRMSPGWMTACCTRVSLTNVPPDEPRSSTTSSWPSHFTSACRRETVASGITTSHDGSRPRRSTGWETRTRPPGWPGSLGVRIGGAFHSLLGRRGMGAV